MKKLIFPALLAAGSLVFFSFKPMYKTELVNGKVVKTLVAPTRKQCDKWDTNHPTNFISCYTVSTEVPDKTELTNQLNKY